MRKLLLLLILAAPLAAQSVTGGNHSFTSLASGSTSGGISSRAWTAGPLYPYRPVSEPTTVIPNTSGYTQVTATSASDLQSKVTGAACNTVISIATGSVYTYTGGLVLPALSCSAGQWVFIRPTGYSGTRGNRIDPSAEVGTMPKLTNSTNAEPVVVCNTDIPCGPFWFQDIELENTTASATYVVFIGQNDSSGTPSTIPGPLVFDHVYAHGRYQNQITHGFELIAVNNFALVDSWVSDLHIVSSDAQAMSPFVGGPQIYQNNFLEGSAENIEAGGSSTALENTYGNIIHDLTERYNWYYRPLQWNSNDSSVVSQGGLSWSIKNQHEYKICQRCLVEYSVLQNNWTASQSGLNFLNDPFNLLTDGVYGMIQDTTYHYLHVIGGGGFSTAGGIDTNTLPHEHLQDRIMYDNILVEDTSGANHCSFYAAVCPSTLNAFQLVYGIGGIIVNHVTATTGSTMTGIFVADPSQHLINQSTYFANNIVFAGTGGMLVNGMTANVPANINLAFTGPDTGSTPWIHNNVFPGMTSVSVPPSGGCSAFYTGTQCPAAMTNVGFTNWNSGKGGDYRLCTANGTPAGCTSGSAYAANGADPCTVNVDGTGGAADCGANVAAINAGIPAGVTTPPANWPDFNSGGGILLTPSSLTCDGTNTIAITPVAGSAGGSGFTLSGLDVMINGTIVSPSASSTSSLTVTPPAFTKTATITNTAMTTGAATITATNDFKIGDIITITGTTNGSGAFNVTGTPVVGTVTGSTFQFRVTGQPTVTSASDSGTVTVTSIPVGVSNFGLPLTAALTCN